MMKTGALLAILLATAAGSSHAADVGVSISVGQPGFYGQIDIGGYPEPRVLYREPRIIEHVHVEERPVYMRVPPGHAKHWDKHCHDYRACNRPVYFVQDDWYEKEYAPRYQERHGKNGKDYHGQGKSGQGKNNHGNGKGKGKDH